MMTILTAINLITLTGPGNQVIEVNPHEVASIRQPRSTDHFAKGTHCLLYTIDGKFITVTETCKRVHELLEEKQ